MEKPLTEGKLNTFDGVRGFIPLVLSALLSASGYADDFSGKVVSITDGDTIHVLWEKQEIKVRLWGIDAPEKKQPFGSKAKQHLSDLIFGKVVYVEEKGKAGWERTLGIVHDWKGASVKDYLKQPSSGLESPPVDVTVNEQMVRDGFAWWYESYAKHATNLKDAQEDAKANKRGLWADKNPIPPWEWRELKFVPVLSLGCEPFPKFRSNFCIEAFSPMECAFKDDKGKEQFIRGRNECETKWAVNKAVCNQGLSLKAHEITCRSMSAEEYQRKEMLKRPEQGI